ncbi:putative flavanone 3-dioxygenase [Helianthus anomalus]
MHTDSGFLTILQDDEGVGGLEVMNKSGDFVPVDPWPGTLLVNLGDMATVRLKPLFLGIFLGVWSNGRFCNVKHRVQCKDANTRVSIASFLLGPEEILEPLPELVDDDHPRVFVPTTYEDYRKLRFSTKLHAGEALALLHTPSS